MAEGLNLFGVWDYVVLVIVLLISTSIGVYYRFTGGKQKTVKEYLLADGNMPITPVAFSLMASFMSAITIMGVSSENYTYGIQFVVINFSYLIFTPVAAYLYLPVFFRLQATSAYEYLEKRFGKITRLFASIAYTLQMVLYMGIVLYAPALTLEALTGISQVAAILSVGLVCTFYSTIGGMKAVLMTDLFQSLLMFAAVFSVIICAVIQTGSFAEIWRIAERGNRTELLNFNPDPTVRHSWFSLIIGGGVTFLSIYAVNQTQVQRYLTVRDLKQAQKALWLNWPILTCLSISTSFSGLAIYSRYFKCDPVAAGIITNTDQLMPYYVVDSMGHIPGLSGLFVAGIFSASLSTISATLNSLAAVMLEDYLKPLYIIIKGKPLPEEGLSLRTKLIAFSYGLVCIAIAFLSQFLGGVLQAALTIFGVVGGPLLGLFSLGMFTTTANQKGVVPALVLALSFSLWIAFGGPKPPLPKLPVGTDCDAANLTSLHIIEASLHRSHDNSDYFWLYRISYIYNGVAGFLCTYIVGYILSFIALKLNMEEFKVMDPHLYIPIIAKRVEARNAKLKKAEMMFDITKKQNTPVPFQFVKFLCIAFILLLNCTEGYSEEVPSEAPSVLNNYPHLPQTDNPVIDAGSKQNLIHQKPNLQCEDGHETIKNSFSWADYLILAAMLIVSCGIGVFYGFFGKKQKTSDDFLLGGSSMGTFPMAMSLAASFITAIELLGNPAEMYNYGTQFWMICVAFIIVVPITSKLYLPVFMTLRLTSSYEYLGLRFNKQTSLLASGLYILQMVLYTSVAVYAPALALSHVTGLNVYAAVSVVYIVCIFYASQGGMKAVIMTDTFQAAVLIISILLVLYFGEKLVGGVGVIWSDNFKTDRLELFNFNPNPAIRHSFWSVVVGGTFYWMTMFCANQASIQKYLSVETISQARSALWVASFGLILIYTINFYTGMVLVSHYIHCDPVKSGEIGATDEILPLFILSQLGHMKGITGFFVAGIFAASLGTVAAALNSLSAVTCKDFITGAFGITMAESKGALWAKWISLVYGIISFGLVFIVEQLGSVMQVALSFNGMVGGVTLGLFSLGMFFPWANSKGALTGGVLSMIFVLWIGLGQQVAVASEDYVVHKKEISIDYCPCLNSTLVGSTETAGVDDYNSHLFFLYRISYLWYSAIGFLLTIIIGLLTSFVTGMTDPKDVDSDLLSPPIKSLLESLPNNVKEFLNVPLKMNSTKDIAMIGVINHAMDINDEKVQIQEKPEKQEKLEKKTEDVDRKISIINNKVPKF